MMGKDFIQRRPRYCIWLLGADPALLHKCPIILDRIDKVRAFRLESTKAATRAKADTPTLFDEIREPKTSYVAFPTVSSERRKYIPIDYLMQDIIPGNKIYFLENASLYHFGVIVSNVHMAWTRATCGRLKSDYNYSNTIIGLCFLLYMVVVYTLKVPYLYRLYIFYHLSNFFVPNLCPTFTVRIRSNRGRLCSLIRPGRRLGPFCSPSKGGMRDSTL